MTAGERGVGFGRGERVRGGCLCGCPMPAADGVCDSRVQAFPGVWRTGECNIVPFVRSCMAAGVLALFAGVVIVLCKYRNARPAL